MGFNIKDWNGDYFNIVLENNDNLTLDNLINKIEKTIKTQKFLIEGLEQEDRCKRLRDIDLADPIVLVSDIIFKIINHGVESDMTQTEFNKQWKEEYIHDEYILYIRNTRHSAVRSLLDNTVYIPSEVSKCDFCNYINPNYELAEIGFPLDLGCCCDDCYESECEISSIH